MSSNENQPDQNPQEAPKETPSEKKRNSRPKQQIITYKKERTMSEDKKQEGQKSQEKSAEEKKADSSGSKPEYKGNNPGGSGWKNKKKHKPASFLVERKRSVT